jgi:hypothetical protein
MMSEKGTEASQFLRSAKNFVTFQPGLISKAQLLKRSDFETMNRSGFCPARNV